MEKGFFLINKNKGPTSFDVVSFVKRKFNLKKAGHSGTLDPLADGLLLIAINKSCKVLQFIDDLDKEYIFTVEFGKNSVTFDGEGPFDKEREIKKFKKEDILKVIEDIKDIKEQMPPVYSAIKYKGKKLYEYAREKKEDKINIKKRKIKIYELELLDFNENSASFRCFCSKGTYIRSLGVDIANSLGNLGFISKLTRSKIGPFKIEDSKTIENIEKEDKLNTFEILSKLYPFKTINKKEEFKVINGQKFEIKFDKKHFLVNENSEVIAFVEDNKIKRVLI